MLAHGILVWSNKIFQETQQNFTLQNDFTAVQLWTWCFKAKLSTCVLASLICYAHLYAFTYGILMLSQISPDLKGSLNDVFDFMKHTIKYSSFLPISVPGHPQITLDGHKHIKHKDLHIVVLWLSPVFLASLLYVIMCPWRKYRKARDVTGELILGILSKSLIP